MIRLRSATLRDLALLQRWDTAPHVIAGRGTGDWDWARELARSPDWREQCIAEVDDVPIGFVQITDPAREDSHDWGECAGNLRAIDIWVGEDDHLGRVFGTQMMRLAIERCFVAPPAGAVVVSPMASNVRAQRFYRGRSRTVRGVQC